MMKPAASALTELSIGARQLIKHRTETVLNSACEKKRTLNTRYESGKCSEALEEDPVAVSGVGWHACVGCHNGVSKCGAGITKLAFIVERIEVKVA